MIRRIFREDHAQTKSSTADRSQEGADAIEDEVGRLHRHVMAGADFLEGRAGNGARHGFASSGGRVRSRLPSITSTGQASFASSSAIAACASIR